MAMFYLYLTISGPIILNLEERKKVYVKCIATGAYPEPSFKWYISGKLLENPNSENNTEKIEKDNGQVEYINTLEYNAKPKDIAKMLICEVTHKGTALETNIVKI